MVRARLIKNETIIEIEAVSEVKRVNVSSAKNHNFLYNRNLPDQHSIDAITGLREALETGADKTYVHEQGIASDTWEIQHNLNKYPSVTLVDSANTQFEAQVVYNDKNNCTVYMNGATKGKAYLN